MAEVRARLDTYHNLAKQLGTTDSQQVATERALLLDHLGTLRAQKIQLQRDIALIDAELLVMDAKERGEIKVEDAVPEELVDAMIMRDSRIALEKGDRTGLGGGFDRKRPHRPAPASAQERAQAGMRVRRCG
jgi:hypothetical protein